MSFMQKLFGGQQVPQQSVPQQQIPGNNPMNNPAPQQPLQTQGTAPNGVIPNDGQKTPAQNEVPPLDQFNNLWQTPPVDPNSPNQEPPKITQEQLMQAAEKVDFRKVIDNDTLTKISAGGQEGTQAFLDAMNKMQQVSFGQSMAAAHKLVAREVELARDSFNKNIPSVIRNHSVKEQLIAANPALAHPAVQPVVTALQSQLAEQYPKATEAQLKQYAETLVTQMGEAFKPTPKAKPVEVPVQEDWSDLA